MLAGTEVAIISVQRSQLRDLMQNRRLTALAVQTLRDDPGPFATAVQVGVTALGVTAGALGALCLAPPMAEQLANWLPFFAPYALLTAVAMVTAGVTLACVVLGDLLPISVALRAPLAYLVLFGRPVSWLSKLLRPLTWLLSTGSDQVVQHLAEEPQTEPVSTPAAMQALIDDARHHGRVHPRAAEIAVRALAFGDLTVADVMVPRNRVNGIAIDATPEDVRRILLEEGHSCMPVYDGTLDQVVGILVAKDVLALAWERELIVLQDLLQPPYFAPEIMHAADLLKELQRRRMHFSIVVDELGGTAGIATVEDLLEELVGEILGEHDAENPEAIRRDADGSTLLQGTVPIRDINRELHLNLAEGDTWSTVGGLCVSLAGRIPEAGNKLSANDGSTLEIVEASDRRVRTVRLRPPHHASGRVSAS